MHQGVRDALAKLVAMKDSIVSLMESYPEDANDATHDKYMVLHALLELISTWNTQVNAQVGKDVMMLSGRRYAAFETAKLSHPRYSEVRFFSPVSATNTLIQTATPFIEIIKNAAHIELVAYHSKYSWASGSGVRIED